MGWSEGSLVVPRRGSMCGRGCRLAAGLGEGCQCPGYQGGRVLTDRVSQRERLSVVVGEQFGLVFPFSGELFDPASGGLVLLGALGAADL